GGAVVSAPAVADGPAAGSADALVLIGSDDGAVYAIDPATGQQRWLYPTGDAIEAPVVVADGVAYVGNRGETLYALDAATGEELWAGGAGAILRTAAVVTAERVYVVDDFGRLLGFDRQSGRRLFATVEENYAGPPLLLDAATFENIATQPEGQILVVGGLDGVVYRFSTDGSPMGQWAVEATGEAAGVPDIDMGPALGGGALWIADDNAVVWRLGPQRAGPVALSPAWFATISDPPFELFYLSSTPAEYRGGAIVVDDARNVYLIEPESGEAVRLLDSDDQSGGPRVDPVVAGDTLLAVMGESLHAIGLPGGDPLWEFEGTGLTYRPVTVAGNTVLWLTQPGSDEPGATTGTLHALDLESGELRWRQPLRGALYVGGAVVREDTVFVATPPAAYDLATGEQLWQADVQEAAVGGPALDESGQTLYVALLDVEADRGSIAAIDAADGSVRWQAELAGEALSPIEPIWLSGDTLVVPSASGAIVGLAAGDGSQRWHDAPNPARLGAVTVAEGRVWHVLENGHVLALDAATGEVVAGFSELELNLSGVGIAQRPVVIGETLLVPMGLTLLGFELPE
ncbi:MAG TPA: PQQ-binding-like beta-propeller repeat protein, partial [Ardenticatenaceae bacterium]|nr:PQQ-binding-like beta-propeller repeat protein [Ardenticatenaceae bacterium]